MQTRDDNTDKQKLSQLMDGEWLDLNAADCVAKLCEDDELRDKWMRYHMIRDAMKSEPVQAEPDLASRICAAIDDEPVYSNITAFSGGGASSSPWAQTASSDTSEESVPHIDVDVSKQPQVEQAADVRKPSMLNTGIAGFALAASVAVVTVVGVNLFQQQDNSAGSTLASSSVEGSGTANTVSTPQVFAAGEGVDAFSRQVEGAPLPVVEFVANTGTYWVTPQSAERVTDEQRLNMMLSQHIENSPTSGREGLLPYSRLVGYDESKPEE